MHSITKRLAAASLSLCFAPGVGHYYLGANRRGCAWAVAYAIVIAAALTIFITGKTELYLASLLVPLTMQLLCPLDVLRCRSGQSPLMARVLLLACAEIAFYSTTVAVLRPRLPKTYRVPSGSMYPSVLPGDIVSVSKAETGPVRGDLIAFRYKQESIHIKRVVAVAGDTIELRNNDVLLNAIALWTSKSQRRCEIEPPCEIREETSDNWKHPIAVSSKPTADATMSRQKIESGTVFVLGDARDWSPDSRHIGNIPIENILGHVDYIWWPPSRAGRYPSAR